MESKNAAAPGKIPAKNGLADDFQLTPEHDPNLLFPKEKEMIKEIRERESRVAEWPDRWIAVFLFTRKHDVERTLVFLKEHIDFMVNDLLIPVVRDGKNPVPWARVDKEFFFEGHTIYREGMTDKYGRLLIFRINRFMVPKKSMYMNYMVGMAHWWYDAMEHVPLVTHRNGMVLVFDMSGMSSKNWDFSSEGSSLHLASFSLEIPLSLGIASDPRALYQFGRAIYKAKVMDRVKVFHKAELKDFIDEKDLPSQLGGTWEYDVKHDWFAPLVERYKPKGPANAWNAE